MITPTDADLERAQEIARNLLMGIILTPREMAPAIAQALADERARVHRMETVCIVSTGSPLSVTGWNARGDDAWSVTHVVFDDEALSKVDPYAGSHRATAVNYPTREAALAAARDMEAAWAAVTAEEAGR